MAGVILLPIVRAEMMIEFGGRHGAAVDLLAEAGSFIAAEIDRVNNLKQE